MKYKNISDHKFNYSSCQSSRCWIRVWRTCRLFFVQFSWTVFKWWRKESNFVDFLGSSVGQDHPAACPPQKYYYLVDADILTCFWWFQNKMSMWKEQCLLMEESIDERAVFFPGSFCRGEVTCSCWSVSMYHCWVTVWSTVLLPETFCTDLLGTRWCGWGHFLESFTSLSCINASSVTTQKATRIFFL